MIATAPQVKEEIALFEAPPVTTASSAVGDGRGLEVGGVVVGLLDIVGVAVGGQSAEPGLA